MKIARTFALPAVVIATALFALPSPALGASPVALAQYDDDAVAGWPEADVGAYGEVSTTNASFSSDAQSTRIRLDRPGASAYGALRDTSAASTDLTFKISADKRPTGAGHAAHVILRDVGSSSAYRLKIRLAADGRVLLRAAAIVGGKRSHALGNEVAVSGVKFTAGRWLKIRAQVLGANPTLIRAKVWNAGESQPAAWKYAVYDNTALLQAKGSIGLGARLPLSSSSAPVTFDFDDLVARGADAPADPTGIVVAQFNTRPYTNGSVWNTPIGANVAYDSHSAQMIATIGLSGNGGELTSDPTQYTYPVYVATAATPRHTVTTTYNVRRYELDGSYTTSGTSIEVPMAPDWGPSAGTDGQLIVIDSTTGDEYDIWQYAGAGSYRATRLGYYVAGTLRDGAPLDYASRGAGVPYFAGLIRPWEIAQGHIDHAIAFAYQFPAQGRCVAPATKTDGTSTLAMAIPEGARLQLDPSLGAADFDRWALSPTGRIIARAMQRYGLILINVAGRPKLYAENIAANPGAALSWADVGGLSASTVSAIPYTALRVLDLPDGYWTGDAGAPKWDSCYR